jgi:general secretion pathway protein I
MRRDDADGTRRGFTLLEILLALSILSVVLLAVYRLHTQSIFAAQSARFQTVAPLLARQKMAEVNLGGLDAIPEPAGNFGERYPGYTWRLAVSDTVSERLGETAGRLKKIDLTIGLDADGSQYRVRAYRFFER